MRTLLPEIEPDESVVVEFSFAGELAAPASALVLVIPINGADPGAAGMLLGTVQISGSSVFQRVKPALAGINYKLRCVATQGDDVRVRVGVLPVRAA